LVKVEAEKENRKKVEAAKKEKTLNILGQPSVLPQIRDPVEKVRERLAKEHVKLNERL